MKDYMRSHHVAVYGLRDAGKWVNRDKNNIMRAIGRNGTCGGYHWEMIE